MSEPGSPPAATTAVVITGAAPLTRRAVARVPVDAVLIAADGGLDHALAAGLEPTVLVGDLDSVTAAGLAWAADRAAAGFEVVSHPVDKNVTDTELAIAQAATSGADRIVLLAGPGDRMDHSIAALGALGAPGLAGIADLEAWWGDDELRVVHGPGSTTLDHPPGTTFSVLAMHGPCHGVTVDGARWPLHAHDLAPLVGLGVSNQIATSPVTVSVSAGIVTIVVPGAIT